MENRTLALPRYVVFFLTFAALGVGAWFLREFSPLFNSFFLAVMIVMTASPFGFWLHEKGVPRWLALGVSVLAALSVTVLIGGVLVAAAFQVLHIVPQFVDMVYELEVDAAPLLKRIGITSRDLISMVPPSTLERVIVDLITMTLRSVSLFNLVVLIVIFMVIEAFIVPNKFRIHDEFGDEPIEIALGFTNSIRQYVGITSLLGIIGGAVISFVLYLIGIPFAFLWGILYFVLNFVPIVGFWFALIPPVLLASMSVNPTNALLVLAAYLIVSTIINQGVKPAVMRGGLDISPFWSIMSLIIWSTILGPLGLVVGVPLTIALKTLILEPDVDGRWIADLLGAGLGEETELLPEPQPEPDEDEETDEPTTDKDA